MATFTTRVPYEKKRQFRPNAGKGGIDDKQGFNKPAPNSPPQALEYPSTIGTLPTGANYILFTMYKRTPAVFKGNKKQEARWAQWRSDIDDMSLAGASKEEIEKEMAAYAQDRKAAKVAQAVENTRRHMGGRTSLHMKQGHTKSGTTIALYMPPSVNAKYAMQYDDPPIGVMSEAIYGIIKDIQAGIQWDKAIKNNAGTVGTGLTQMGLKMIDTVIPGAKDLVAMERGMIIAPRTEVMFQGISKRTFSFNFVFIPKSREETETIDKIIYEFKKGMTPAFRGNLGTVRELNFPDMFGITYMHMGNENQFINKIGKCFLESADVSYGGERFVTFDPVGNRGGPPNKITLALSFREIEIMDQSKINQGY